MKKFTIIATISDNGLNVEFEHVRAKTATQAMQAYLDADAQDGIGIGTVIAVVPGWVEKALEDGDIEEVMEEFDSW